jgi:DNA mismatch repair protein MutH
VRRKLARVLWVPVDGARELLPSRRRIGQALLWSPSAEEEAALRFDWEHLSGLIARGQWDDLTGHVGNFLQVRPKARNGVARRRAIDAEGRMHSTLPRGFYLRATFTASLIGRHYVIAPPRP